MTDPAPTSPEPATYTNLRTNVEDFVGVITLDRPPVNALNGALAAEIASAAMEMEKGVKDRRVRVVVLDAAGEHFCAGADLKERNGMPESEVADAVRAIRGAVDAIYRISAPVIAAIHGRSYGGGFELALAADIRVLADNAEVGLREVTLGIMPGAGGTQRLPRIVGEGVALEWITTGRSIPADEAQRSGAASAVVPAGELAGTVSHIASQIAANAPLAVQAAKKAVRDGMRMGVEDALALEWEAYETTIPTRDRREGLRAFAEKRTPRYTGE